MRVVGCKATGHWPCRAFVYSVVIGAARIARVIKVRDAAAAGLVRAVKVSGIAAGCSSGTRSGMASSQAPAGAVAYRSGRFWSAAGWGIE